MSEEQDQGLSERDALAAEYALGVLGPAERRDAEALLASDASFAASVARWRRELSPLVETAPSVSPPAALWDRIEAELTPAPRAAEPAKRGLWSSLAFWRGLSFASMAAAAALAAVVLTPTAVAPTNPATQNGAQQAGFQLATAPVMMENGPAIVAAAFDPTHRQIVVTPTGRYELQPTQVMELWIIVGDNAPRSLGLIDPRNPRAHQLPADVRADLAAGAALAVSVEPTGGSPTGAPTGPVIAQGKFITI